MEHMLYLMVFPFMLYEIFRLWHTEEQLEFVDSIENGDKTSMRIAAFILISYLFWIFLGVLSSHWIAFILLVMLACLQALLHKIFNHKSIIIKIDASLTIILFIAIIISKYHYPIFQTTLFQ